MDEEVDDGDGGEGDEGVEGPVHPGIDLVNPVLPPVLQRPARAAILTCSSGGQSSVLKLNNPRFLKTKLVIISVIRQRCG